MAIVIRNLWLPRRIFLALLSTVALLLTFSTGTAHVSARAALPHTWSGGYAVQIATPASISGNYTLIDNAFSNNNPNALLIVSQDWYYAGHGGTGGTYNNHPVGVWYNAAAGKWAIFNEDGAPMTPNVMFNIILWSARGLDNSGAAIAYMHIAHTTAAASTDIDNSVTNNNPNAHVFVTPNANPPGGSAIYDNHPVGVWYNNATHHWAIYNDDFATMPANAAFNVVAYPASYDPAYTLTSNSSNSAGDYTNLTDGLSNIPGSLVFVTHVWNPGGTGGTYHNHNLGVWFNSAVNQWSIFNEDQTTMPPGVSFNVLVQNIG